MFPDVPELTEGRHLFETQGCRGCHKLNGVGGSIGPDLTEEGANHRSPEWLERHFLTPNAVSAGSAMPNFHFTREQARDLTYYMLSLTSEEMGTYYSSLRLDSQVPRTDGSCLSRRTASSVTRSAESAQRPAPIFLASPSATHRNGSTNNSSIRS